LYDTGDPGAAAKSGAIGAGIGAVGNGLGLMGGTRAPSNPIEGLPRTGSALKLDPYHAFPNVVDNFACDAMETQLQSGASLFEVEGSLNGIAGRFEWIVDGSNVTHRMFVPSVH
jgi:hypothetical protein